MTSNERANLRSLLDAPSPEQRRAARELNLTLSPEERLPDPVGERFLELVALNPWVPRTEQGALDDYAAEVAAIDRLVARFREEVPTERMAQETEQMRKDREAVSLLTLSTCLIHHLRPGGHTLRMPSSGPPRR